MSLFKPASRTRVRSTPRMPALLVAGAVALGLLLPARSAAAQPLPLPPARPDAAALDAAEQAPRVEVSLHADGPTLEPGRTRWFGIRLTIEPGWHVYWQNPGDAGMATQVQWFVPDGWTVSDLHWPVPARFHDAGGLLAYGYEHEVVLLAAITPPGDIIACPVTEAPVSVRVQWLACRDRCVLGEATLDVATGSSGAEPATLGSEDDARLIQQWRHRVPCDVNADPLVRDVRTQTLDASGTLTQRVLVGAVIDWADDVSDVAWYPATLPDAEVVDVVATTSGRETRIEAAVTGLPPRFRGYKVLPGVLAYHGPDGTLRAAEIALEMNTADSASDLPTDDEREQP